MVVLPVRTDEAGDGRRRLADLLVGLGPALGGGADHAALEVLVLAADEVAVRVGDGGLTACPHTTPRGCRSKAEDDVLPDGRPLRQPGRRELVHSIPRSLWVLTRERRLVNRPRRPRECRQISAQRFPSTVRGRHRSWSGPFRGRWSAIVPRRPPACAQVACVSPTGDLRLCTGAVDNGLPGRRRAAYVVPWSFRGQRLRQKCQRCNLRSGRDGWEAARRRRPPGGDVPAERE